MVLPLRVGRDGSVGALAARAGHFLARVGRAGLDLVVPPLCLSCRRPLAEPNALCGSCWRELELIGPPFCPITGIPLPFDAGPGTLATELKWRRPLYDKARAATVFGPMSQRLVHQLKYQDVPGIAPLMARLMLPRIGELADGADVMVPVPLHRRRLAFRKFNQAALLASALARTLPTPVDPLALVRVRSTPPQVGLSREERAQNLAGAFKVRNRTAVDGKTILVIDDVLTTGSTMDAIALSLKAAGATEVRVGVFARVVGPIRDPA